MGSQLARRVTAAEERRSRLVDQLDEVDEELWRARREREDLVARQRAAEARRVTLAYALARGEDPVVPAEDAAAVTKLAAELPAALAERRRREREHLRRVGHVPLAEHEFDWSGTGARRRGFADSGEG
jgi:hypothetical protein